MNRKTALMLHEMRVLRWFLLVGGVCVLIFGMVLSSQIQNYLSVNDYSSGEINMGGYATFGSYFSASLVYMLKNGHQVLVPLFAVLTVIQFSDYHHRKNQEFMSSLPFTQTGWIMTKVLLGCGVITVCCLFMGVVTFAVRSVFIDEIQRMNLLSAYYKVLCGNETIWHTLRSLVLFWLILIALYLIFALLHCLVNQRVLASLMGIGVVLAPVELLFFIDGFSKMPGKKYIVSEAVKRMGRIFFGGETSISTVDSMMYFDRPVLLAYDSMLPAVLLLLLVMLLCVLGIFAASRKKDLARDGMVITLSWARILISAGMAICFATTIIIMAFGMYPENKMLYAINSLGLSVILFLVFMKLFKCNVK